MPVVVYSALRLALLAATLVAGVFAGLRDWLLVVVATLVAWGLSYVLLRGPRDAAARWLADRAERRRAAGLRFTPGVEADEDAEDAEAEAIARSERGDDGADPAEDADARAQSDRPSPSSTP